MSQMKAAKNFHFCKNRKELKIPHPSIQKDLQKVKKITIPIPSEKVI